MVVLAKSVKGAEYMYKPSTAHKVSKASAKKICDVLNESNWRIKEEENAVWHIHEIDKYDRAYDYATEQAFTIYKGVIKEKKSAWLL